MFSKMAAWELAPAQDLDHPLLSQKRLLNPQSQRLLNLQSPILPLRRLAPQKDGNVHGLQSQMPIAAHNGDILEFQMLIAAMEALMLWTHAAHWKQMVQFHAMKLQAQDLMTKKMNLSMRLQNAHLRVGTGAAPRGLLQLMDTAARVEDGLEILMLTATMEALMRWTNAARRPNLVISNASFLKEHALHHQMIALVMQE
jgi:hypothetical protein